MKKMNLKGTFLAHESGRHSRVLLSPQRCGQSTRSTSTNFRVSPLFNLDTKSSTLSNFHLPHYACEIISWIQEEESEDRWRTTIACLNDPSCTKHHYDPAGTQACFACIVDCSLLPCLYVRTVLVHGLLGCEL